MTIRDLGLALTGAVPWLRPAGRRLYNLLPQFLHDTPTSRAAAFFANAEDVNFMQIGAYDGMAGDPVRPLVLSHPRWRGVLVEPQPHAHARLKRTYEGHPLHLLQAAVSSQGGQRTLHFIEESEIQRLRLPDWAREIASFDPYHVQRHFPQARISSNCVTTMTFAEATRSLPGERVDLVVIDVEGHETEILRSIDFDRHRVRFLIYEHKHLSADERQRLGDLLRGYAFRMKSFGRDTIAWRRAEDCSRPKSSDSP